MNGPAHYVEAERLICGARVEPPEALPMQDRMMLLAAAQMHATLALAAATAMVGIDRMPEEDFREWDKAAGVPTRSGDGS